MPKVTAHPQLRKDPVTREWVIVATGRSKRTDEFKIVAEPPLREHEDACPFCPGNEYMTPPEVLAYRSADSAPNKPGWWARVVPNKFPALAIEGELDRTGYGMYDQMNGIGAHEVIIESVDHNRSIATVTGLQAQEVFWAYRDRVLDLTQDKRFQYILLFKNKGRIGGASQPHSHCQLVATPIVPANVMLKIAGAARYYDFHDRCIYCDMLKQEEQLGERIVAQNPEFVAFCPFAAKYPYETWIMPRRHMPSFAAMERGTINAFASICQYILRCIGASLNDPPYNFMLHTAPVNQDRECDFHWHLTIMPRLTIAAGFELGTGIYINVTAPEDAASDLRVAELNFNIPPVAVA
ncbi:MAG: galactose-1-phosphate uridylyltransferase [Patescibacteria group bacterium]|jgi:UDPglucose--hexose-1-phosphate uridylyltransferase